ncbi:MAG: ribonuclease [Rhizobiales bacterium]|nr:ribonuclease [Hyphomicrobiales bacterium]MBO6697434.1 ribonuclease [Hyphomicrobiales bacterium]MBO6736311.1 ribonuclease [Hyphomicrobiales bacterium]MBO6912781.1 ribonuclease [Hyphomicrobiales bacterium]MBO6953949.1 ribonuclease [Hyphomicrobiales bacterium]
MNRRLVQWGVIALAIAIAVATGWQNDQPHESADQPFDFYVLALSWSPAYCATEAGQRSPLQCASGANYGFVTHGLWPQFEDGWPSFCQSPHGDSMPDDIANTLLDIMPDRGLIEHQWDRHGTCTGFDQQTYADLIRDAGDRITLPSLFDGTTPARLDADAIEATFVDANSGLRRDAIAISCPGGRFAEVRLCLDTTLTPRACAQVDRNGCRQANLPIAAR